ncbi:DNA polymerase [Pelagibacter phage Hroenn EXVC015P]|nr:DNA polymerase [Pelagibacter phage Bylgja EXVC010P]QLF88337.1 DNA polymerase [Pelagibacter phage Himinglaeva EXVC011P]QLF88368.1 DNA polymerase [Pelagibacter phage Hroenn EXVC015P]QLF88585.1 DNA polymerase [Pelagibacter phage Unn EXVC019P]
MKYVFDLESNGLYNEVSTIHCIVLKDIETNKIIQVDVNEALKLLSEAELIIGHNIIKYDIPVLKKLYGFKTKAKVFDTLVATRLIWSDLTDSDMKRVHTINYPRSLVNRHSLKAWGIRLGNYKQQIDTDWSVFTQEMLEYCIQDVEVTHTLYQKILGQKIFNESLDIEHAVAELISRQEIYGVMFDKEKATKLYAELSSERDTIKQEMEETFKPITIKRVSEKTGKPLKDKVVEFNPSSRRQIADRLKTKYNWKPVVFTNDGLAKVDDTVLNSLDFPEAKLLARYFLLEKRIGMLAEGKQAYLKLEKQGRLHGTVNTNAAVTGRATASQPNLQQVPSVGVPYGKQFRELFTVPKNKSLVGCDVSGLELRILGHYIAKFDNGSYADVVVNGDIHTENQKLAGLDTRDQSKRFLYAWLYGAGVSKIAEVTGKSNKDAAQVKKRFLNRLPALSKLIKQVQLSAERGYLVGLDKRHIKIRNSFSALNSLLQGAGAVVCKQWLIEFDKAIKDFKDVQQVLWVHDEIQIECPKDKADEIGKLAVECIKRTGKHFNLRVPLTGEYKISTNWSGTH